MTYFLTRIILVPLFILIGIAGAGSALAASADSVSGYAWSENIGWISFNCKDLEAVEGKTCLDGNNPSFDPSVNIADYGVDIHSVTNVLSGYAWSDNVGWISFNLADTGNPPAEYDYSAQGYTAEYDAPNNELRGWARALSALETQGAWDGWIKLHKYPSDTGAAYGVTWNSTTKELEEWAWGSDVIGWISMNCKNDHDADTAGVQSVCATSNYQVKAQISLPPSLSNFSVQKGDYCTVPAHTLSWTFTDPEDGLLQTSYLLEASLNSDFSTQEVSLSGGSATAITLPAAVQAGPNQLAYNSSYYWRVKAFDSGEEGGKDTGWVYFAPSSPGGIDATMPGETFSTEPHFYPDAKFTYSPSSPSEGEGIGFSEAALCYAYTAGDPSASIACPATGANYKWDFDYKDDDSDGLADFTVDATGKTATTTYNDIKQHFVAFEITDQDGFACRDTSQSITPEIPLPIFRETPPRR